MKSLDQKIEKIKAEQAELDRRTSVEEEALELIGQCRFLKANELLDALGNKEFQEEEKKKNGL